LRRLRGLLPASRSEILPLLFPALLYLGTLLPGVGHSGDSAQLSLCAHLLAVPHPTGYPLYIALVHGLGRLLPLNPALVANLFSMAMALAALLVMRKLLAALGVGRAAGWAAVFTLSVSPTFWEHAVTAEVYALHAFLLLLVLLLFVRWAAERSDSSFYGACFVYALGFGNHLLMITLLPAIVVLVLMTRPQAFLEPRRVVLVLAMIAVGALQYGLLLWRGADGAAAYREEPINGLGDLLSFATGAKFHGQMFAFGAREWLARLLSAADRAVGELAPIAFFVPIGLVRLGRTPVNLFLALAFLANLIFALGYDISDLWPYFIPNHCIAVVYAAVGLDAVIRRVELDAPARLRWLSATALLWPIALAAVRWPAVVVATKPDAGAWARSVLADMGPNAIVISAYEDNQFLLYYRLAEGRGRAGPYLADESIGLAEVLRYLRDGQPMKLPQLGTEIPPGLELYSQKLFNPRHYQRAGLQVETVQHDLYRISYPGKDR
jgi:hypothetical protein